MLSYCLIHVLTYTEVQHSTRSNWERVIPDSRWSTKWRELGICLHCSICTTRTAPCHRTVSYNYCPWNKMCQFNTHDTPLIANSTDVISQHLVEYDLLQSRLSDTESRHNVGIHGTAQWLRLLNVLIFLVCMATYNIFTYTQLCSTHLIKMYKPIIQ